MQPPISTQPSDPQFLLLNVVHWGLNLTFPALLAYPWCLINLQFMYLFTKLKFHIVKWFKSQNNCFINIPLVSDFWLIELWLVPQPILLTTLLSNCSIIHRDIVKRPIYRMFLLLMTTLMILMSDTDLNTYSANLDN